MSQKPNDRRGSGALSASFAKIENTELLVGGWREREREGARGTELFSLSGWWALKNGNPIVSTAHRRSFTADTRKPTLYPKPGVPSFSLRADPRPPYSFRSFYQFSPRIRWKGPRALRRIVKYFTLDPGPPFCKNSSAYLISRKHSTRNLIQSLTSECRYKSLGHALYILASFLILWLYSSFKKRLFSHAIYLLFKLRCI